MPTQKASVHFDARDLALVAFGTGVDIPIREKLEREFTQQNPDVILLDTFASIAIQHIAATLRGNRDKPEFASRFEVTTHERSYIVRLDVMKDCDVHVEVYHLRDKPDAETIVQQHRSSGPFEARIEESKIRSCFREGSQCIRRGLALRGEGEEAVHNVHNWHSYPKIQRVGC